MILVIGFWTFLRAALCGSAAIALENTALRHQLAVLQRSGSRPRLRRWDRIVCSMSEADARGRRSLTHRCLPS